MKRFIGIFLLVFTACCFISCGSTPKPEPAEPSASEIDEVEDVEEIEAETITQEDDIVDVDEVAEVIDVTDDEDAEYLRSTNKLSSEELVTKEEFADDKAEILRIISELQEIMDKEDVNAWLKYIAPASIKYYSNPANIRKAQKKLPNKTIQLKGIGDYFKYVFIPSRKRSQVDEIRYISKTNIKAVNVKDDGSIIVYYQFVKIDGKWLVDIPKLD